MKIIKDFKSQATLIIKAFEKKQDLNFETKQTKGLIIDWLYETLDQKDKEDYINYQSYCKGLRYEDLTSQ